MLNFNHFFRISILWVLHCMIIIMVFRDTVWTYLPEFDQTLSLFSLQSDGQKWLKMTKSYRSTVTLFFLALLLVVLHKYVCRSKSLIGLMLPNSGPKNKVSMSMSLSMHVFLKTLLVLDTLFQETLAATGCCEQIYRPVWRTFTTYHTLAALRPLPAWTYL